MIRRFGVVLACALLAACTTTNVKLATATSTRPAPGAHILVLEPDIQLNVLTASGMQEPKADWSAQARHNLAADFEAGLKARSHNFQMLDPSTAMSGRPGQLLRLHDAVGQSIMAFGYAYALPTKKGAFDWTLGDGAQSLGEAYHADYALFVTGRGSYASAGRIATAVGLSLLGVGVPLGSQQVFCSLVDLKTGQVIWFNQAVAGPNADMRDPTGSQHLVEALFKTLPL
jgi:hypothetical protein